MDHPLRGAAAMTPPAPQPDLTGLVSAGCRAQKLMDRAAALSDIALDAGVAGRGREANVISAEAAKCRRDAQALLDPYWKQLDLADYADALVRSTKDNPNTPDAVEPFSEELK
jgi:hypothetical protein